MDFRILVLGLSLLAWPVAADTDKDMDDLVSLIYQYPDAAKQKLEAIGQQPLTQQQQLRQQVLMCQTLVQLGEHRQAINLAQTAQQQARHNKLEQAIVYFQTCEADAYGDQEDFKRAFTLLDIAIEESKNRNQPQAIVGSLRLKGTLEYAVSNYSAAIESLRLALDVYPDLEKQRDHWVWPPIAYLYADMAGVMHATGDLSQADYYLDLALKTPETKGKIKQALAVMGARIALDAGDRAKSLRMLQSAIELLPEISSPLEKAFSQAQIGSIELMLGNLAEAEADITAASAIFVSNKNLLWELRVERLLAQIRIAQKRPDAALRYLNSSANLAQRLSQYDDLSRTYFLEAKLYAENDDYKNAYLSMLKNVAAGEKAQQKLNNTQFMQYKAKLELQEQQKTKAQQLISEAAANQQQQLNRIYAFIIFLLLIIAGLATWIFGKSRGWNLAVHLNQSSDEQLAEHMLNTAKNAGYPLSVLLLDIRHVRQIELPLLQDEIEKKLREQDKLLQHSATELLILLPYTSAIGSERVIAQLEPVLQRWHTAKIHLGAASLTQPDTLQTLLKRANANQLNRSRSDDGLQSAAR